MRSVWLGVFLVAAACRAGTGGQAAAALVDDAGDTVAVRVPAHRIASLIPAATELLFAIGAGDRLVGRTEWCDYPPEARRVARGHTHGPRPVALPDGWLDRPDDPTPPTGADGGDGAVSGG